MTAIKDKLKKCYEQRFSSAGLLYVYINGYKEDEMIYSEQTNSYQCIGNEFYNRIMDSVQLTDNNDDCVHIFGIIGSNEKASYVYSIFQDGIRNNYKRILGEEGVETNTNKLDDTGNIFYRCVQEIYCERAEYFPNSVHFSIDDDISFYGIYGSKICEEEIHNVTDQIVELWLEREKPMLCGQQLMIKSFFLRDFVGRKMIAALPESQTGLWRIIFEGGHQLNLSEDFPYLKETLHPDDLGSMCSSNVQFMLMNPIYAYGKWFQPNDICEEWHKVFLHLCAISEKDWNSSEIRKIYEQFLGFLEDNICWITDVQPIIPKEQYANVLLIHIQNYRSYFKGEDEMVVSKDLYQTLNSRYVYLPYLWQLVNPVISENTFSDVKLHELTVSALEENDTNKKGLFWEDVAAYVLNGVKGWKITGRRIKTGAQEIDLSVINVSLDDELWQLGAYILVECKNWNTHVDIHQIRNIAHISNMKGNHTAILFASNGVTSDAQEEIYRLVMSNIFIICVTANDVKRLHSSADCKELILNKWMDLQEKQDISSMI